MLQLIFLFFYFYNDFYLFIYFGQIFPNCKLDNLTNLTINLGYLFVKLFVQLLFCWIISCHCWQPSMKESDSKTCFRTWSDYFPVLSASEGPWLKLHLDSVLNTLYMQFLMQEYTWSLLPKAKSAKGARIYRAVSLWQVNQALQ